MHATCMLHSWRAWEELYVHKNQKENESTMEQVKSKSAAVAWHAWIISMRASAQHAWDMPSNQHLKKFKYLMLLFPRGQAGLCDIAYTMRKMARCQDATYHNGLNCVLDQNWQLYWNHTSPSRTVSSEPGEGDFDWLIRKYWLPMVTTTCDT